MSDGELLKDDELLESQKKELRKQLLSQRNQLTTEELIAKSMQIQDQLFEMEEFKKALLIMVYVDFRNEVKTDRLIAKCLKQGKRVVVPITDIPNKALILSEILDFPDDLCSGTWGILEPCPDKIRVVEPSEVDLVIVPGVGFSPQGDRLGYGGGFYDRFLPRTRPETTYTALAFELQIKEKVFPGIYDCPMHYIITEDRILSFKK